MNNPFHSIVGNKEKGGNIIKKVATKISPGGKTENRITYAQAVTQKRRMWRLKNDVTFLKSLVNGKEEKAQKNLIERVFLSSLNWDNHKVL